MARKSPPALPDHAPSGKPWALGIRTWNKGGASYGGFKWNLAIGARTEAPDWNAVKECGNGLHCLAYGVGDWSLVGDLVAEGRVAGVVRYDPDLAVDLGDKIKAPWMEVVITTETASLGSVLTTLTAPLARHVLTLTQTAASTGYGSPAASTGDYSPAASTGARSPAASTGDYSPAASTGARSPAASTGYGSPAASTGARSPAASTGDYSPAASTGYGSPAASTGARSPAASTGARSPAASTGDYSPAASTGARSPAASTGYGSPAAALGAESAASAAEGGGIVLTRYGKDNQGRYTLLDVAAAMVGQELRGVLIEPLVAYRLTTAGVEVAT